MKTKNLIIHTSSLLVLLFLLSGCGVPVSTPTAVPTAVPPTATSTAVPPTATSTAIPPTATPLPVVYIQGTIHFTGARKDPFATSIELHGKDDFKNTVTIQASADGKYAFSDIKPGNYNLWVLVNTAAKMIPNCTDVIFPDNTWEAGIKIDQNTAITTKTTSFSKAINVSIAFGSSGWQSSATGSSTATGLYAVSPVIELTQGKTIKLDIVLTCK